MRTPLPHGPEASEPQRCSGQFRSGAGSVSLLSPQGDAGKGVGVQPRAPAGAGGAHICAASCSPWDLLSAQADG